MPSVSNHVCRISNKEHDKFRSAKRKHDGKEYTIRYGRIKADKKWEEYEYFYPVEHWIAAEAKNHCKDHEGKFEAASKSLEGAIEFLEEIKAGQIITAANLKLISNASKALWALLEANAPPEGTQSGEKSLLIPGSIGRLRQDKTPQPHLYLDGIDIPKSKQKE